MRIFAAAVHCLTALGGALGLFALLSAANGNWVASFVWLGVALAVDGIDGPLARLANVKGVLPRYSGDTLDKVVDYLTYVTAPAFIVAQAHLVPERARVPLAATIMLVSLYHFADTGSKTETGYFVGFPAIWNIVVLYCFTLALTPMLAASVIVVCAVLTFAPLHWVHPFRVRRLRLVTIVTVLAWAAASISVLAHGFPGSPGERMIFLLSGAYIIAVGVTGKADDRSTALRQ